MAKVLNFCKPTQTFFCVKLEGEAVYLKVTDSYGYATAGEGKGSVWNSKITAQRRADQENSRNISYAEIPDGKKWRVHPVQVSCVVLDPIM